MQNFNIKMKFDVIISMFAAVDYLVKEKDFKSLLLNVKNHLKKNSIFIFDFWNADAVIKHYSPFRKKEFQTNDYFVTRQSKTKLLRRKNICHVGYKLLFSNRKENETGKAFEDHFMKFYDLENLRKLLLKAGFRRVNFYPFLKLSGKITSKNWDVIAVAKF